ncbi:MAG: glutamate 5-kinase [Verrucomicrobiales bacterium]
MSDNPKRIVVKFGSGILTNPDRVSLDDAQFDALTSAISDLKRDGHEVIIVSSGAVAAGLMAFKLSARPTDTSDLQACAAVGQSRLMHFYQTLFREHQFHVAQLLLTNEDIYAENRRRNFENTLERLLRFDDVIPIINENDSVAIEELKFGDNDTLSARVAVIARADLLILLTSVDGIQTSSDNNEIIQDVHDIADVLCHVRDETGHFSVGGMQTKLKAVEISTTAGVETLIANGRRAEQLAELVAGQGICTRIYAKPRNITG